MKPLLKWAGGKRHIAQLIESYLPSDWNENSYFEPFIGGAALFLHLEPKRAFLSDVNPWLIGFYEDLKGRPESLVHQIRSYAEHFDSLEPENMKGGYLEFRDAFNETEPSIQASALFYVLNKLCFNGLYRENAKGKFNVPFGQKGRFPPISPQEFTDASKRLSGASLRVVDFEGAVSQASSGDFVYFDPPYIPLTATASFTSYSSAGFGLNEQLRLATTMADLKHRGVKAILSNSATALTREVFADFRQVTISAPRMVSAKASGRGSVDELLIMNF